MFAETQRILPLKAVLGEHRETYAYISRLHKDIEKQFTLDPDVLSTQSAVPFPQPLLDRIVAQQLVLEGSAESCEELQQLRGLEVISPNIRSQYLGIMMLVKCLDEGNIDQALSQPHDPPLDPHLLFQLHKLKFVRILKSQPAQAAIEYAKSYFEAFTTTDKGEIERLMGALIFANNLADSPYRDLTKPDFESRIVKEVMLSACKSIGLPITTSLETVISAGIQALPQLAQSVPLLGDQLWHAQFPFELKLTPDLRFHSLCVCPVSKEVVGPDNPPMLLPCGHVICQHSLESLAKSFPRGKFKCPTCPLESTTKDAMQITF